MQQASCTNYIQIIAKKCNDSSNKAVNIWRLECTACISEGDRVNVMINWNLCIVENIGTTPDLVKNLDHISIHWSLLIALHRCIMAYISSFPVSVMTHS